MWIAVCAALAFVALPAASASATNQPGSNFLGCYGIHKKGNYNWVRAHVWAGTNSAHRIAGAANLGVSAACQRINSLPVVTMTIYRVELKSRGRALASAGSVSTSRKALISRATPYVGVACGVPMQSWAEIGYKYYNRSYVRAFWIHGPRFYRC
jgi:hypothetical protein